MAGQLISRWAQRPVPLPPRPDPVTATEERHGHKRGPALAPTSSRAPTSGGARTARDKAGRQCAGRGGR
jgi:hypothetical protein